MQAETGSTWLVEQSGHENVLNLLTRFRLKSPDKNSRNKA